MRAPELECTTSAKCRELLSTTVKNSCQRLPMLCPHLKPRHEARPTPQHLLRRQLSCTYWKEKTTLDSGKFERLPASAAAASGPPAAASGSSAVICSPNRQPERHAVPSFIPQTGTVGVLNSYYNGSMDKMIRGPDPR